MRTMTIKKNSGNWSTGWHELTISMAKYGTYSGSKFLELGFDGYPENFTLRIYAKQGKDGEEFAIGNVFRYANAGIIEVLEGPGGDKVAKIDDTVEQIIDHHLNIFFYKDGEYTRAYSSVAPTEFENSIDTFTANDVEFWKTKAETRFKNYTPGNGTNGTAGAKVTTNGSVEATTSTEDLPF